MCLEYEDFPFRRQIMQRIALIILICLGTLVFASCGAPSGGNGNANSNANTIMIRSAGPPDRAQLIAAENTAYEAWKNKNGTFFEDFLTTGFITFGPQGRQDKAAAVKEIAESDCQINSYALSDEAVTVMGADGAVLTFKAATDGTCDGQKRPSPQWAATVYVRDADKWKAAYHNEVSSTGTDAGQPPATSAPAAAAETQPEQPPADGLTQQLLAAEQKGWEGRKNKDLKAIAGVTMLDLTYIDAAGSGRYTRDEAAKQWIGPACSIKSFSLSEPLARPIAANAAVLTYKATIDGNCGTGSAKSIWGTTIYMKESGQWRALLIIDRPA